MTLQRNNLKLKLWESLIVIFGVVLLYCNCKPECHKANRVIRVEKRFIPYNGTETLFFLRNGIDTQNFIGQGMESFYETIYPQDDYSCVHDYESIRIRFLNPKSNKELKMECVCYLPGQYYLFNLYYDSLYYKGVYSNSYNQLDYSVNGVNYSKLSILSAYKDTSSYILFGFPSSGSSHNGFVKIKYLSDTLTLIR